MYGLGSMDPGHGPYPTQPSDSCWVSFSQYCPSASRTGENPGARVVCGQNPTQQAGDSTTRSPAPAPNERAPAAASRPPGHQVHHRSE